MGGLVVAETGALHRLSRALDESRPCRYLEEKCKFQQYLCIVEG